MLSDGDRLLDIAGLTRDEREAWKLKAQLSEAEIASVLKRQRKTVQALVERAEFKLRGLTETLAEPKQIAVVDGASGLEHTLLSGPCAKEDCTLLHWYCSCGAWSGSTVLNEESNRREWIAHSAEAICGGL